jgi:YVTN family beta-propeller protein
MLGRTLSGASRRENNYGKTDDESVKCAGLFLSDRRNVVAWLRSQRFETQNGRLKTIPKHGDGPLSALIDNCEGLIYNKYQKLAGKLFAVAIVLIVSAIVCARARAQEPSTSLLNASRAIALNAKTGKVYAVDHAQGAVAVFDRGKAATGSVKVGKDPVALAINEATNRIYVANNASGSVSVIDGTNDVVVATVNVGALPYVLAVNPVTNKIFVSNTFSDVITLIDSATNAMSTIKAGSADSIVIDTKRDRAYLIGWEGTSLTVLDSKPAIIGKVQMGGMHLWGMAVDEAAGKLYVTRAGNAELAIVDEAFGSVTNIATGAIPCAVAVNPSTNRIYVVNHEDNTVNVIDGISGKALATVKVGEKPQGIVIDAKANRIYVANVHGDSVSVIDGTRNAVIGTLRTGHNPYALVVNDTAARLYAVLQSESFLTVTDLDYK